MNPLCERCVLYLSVSVCEREVYNLTNYHRIYAVYWFTKTPTENGQCIDGAQTKQATKHPTGNIQQFHYHYCMLSLLPSFAFLIFKSI